MSVTISYGQILIQCERDRSTTTVHEADGRVRVTADGRTYAFDAAQVTSITWVGSRGGGDTFASDAKYTTIVMTYAGNNRIGAGHGYNQVYLMGDNNIYDTGGYPSLVYTYGKGNRITGANLQWIAY